MDNWAGACGKTEITGAKKKKAWDVHINNIKATFIFTIGIIAISTGYKAISQITFSSMGQPYISAELVPKFGIEYEYTNDTVTTSEDWLKHAIIRDNNDNIIVSDTADNRQELIEKMNSNIGERVCVTNINNAIRVVESSTELVGEREFVNLRLKNELPMEINDINFTVVAHSDDKLYFEIPFHIKDLKLKPYEITEINLATNVKGSEAKMKTELSISLSGGYVK